MTARDGRLIEENTIAGLRIYLDLLRCGIPAFCPHLSGAFPSAWSVLSHAEWLAHDCAIIDRCTHVLMMVGWETSIGARHERAYAESIGRPVVESVDELISIAERANGQARPPAE